MSARAVLGLFAVFAVAYGVTVAVMLVVHFRGGQVEALGQFAYFSKFFGPIALGIWAWGKASKSAGPRAGRGEASGCSGSSPPSWSRIWSR